MSEIGKPFISENFINMFQPGNKCCYRNCGKSQRKNPGLHMFTFPVRNKERCKEWIKNSGCKTTLFNMPLVRLQYMRICEDHFEASAFTNTLKQRLIHSAVPVSYEESAAGETNKSLPFEQVFIVSEQFEESLPPTTLHEDQPLILNRTKNVKTYEKKMTRAIIKEEPS